MEFHIVSYIATPYFKCCKVHFSGQVYFTDHKECFNCSIKYCWPHVLYSRLIARAAQPARLITQPEQADSPSPRWMTNQPSQQPTEGKLLDSFYRLTQLLWWWVAENNVAVSFMSINKQILVGSRKFFSHVQQYYRLWV